MTTQLLRFGLVGVAGYAVDAGVLYAALGLGLGTSSGRLVSFLSAVMATWLLNRRFTFQPFLDARAGDLLIQEWLKYLAAMSVGGVLNLCTYALIMASWVYHPALPALAVAAGSLVGMLANFAGAKWWVYRERLQASHSILNMKLRSLVQPALCALALLGLFLLLRNLLLFASTTPVSFDGAMNLNTAASLAAGNGYGFFYDTYFPFPAQTDGPFIFPAAILISIFGVSPLVTQSINLAYIGFLIPLLTTLLRRLGMPLWAALAGTLIVISVPGITEFGMNGYGEIPSLVWYLSGLLTFGTLLNSTHSRHNALLAGSFLAAAYLTKVVSLVLVAPLFGTVFVFMFQQHISRKTFTQLCLGFLFPVISWEFYRAVEIGSISGYLTWWKLQLGQILHQSGASHSLAGFVHKATEHFSILSEITGLSTFLLAAFLVLPYFLFILVEDRRSIAEKFYYSCLLWSGLAYFSWWLLLTPTSMAWLRRIMDGVVIHQLLLCALGFSIISSMLTGTRSIGLKWWTAFVFSLGAVFPVLTLSKNGQKFTEPIKTPAYVASFFQLVSLVRELPADAVIFGTGWWQSPALALYSGRRLHNFQHWTPDEINGLKRKYFAFDHFTVGIAKSDVVNALALTDTQEMFKSDGGALYLIDKARLYAPIEITRSNLAKLKSKMDFSEEDYEFKSGFYPAEDHKWAWMRTDGLVVLDRTSESRIVISFLVPDQLLKEKKVELNVEVPGCAKGTFPLSKPGENTVKLTLNCPASEERMPLYSYFHVNQHMPFANQIDSENRLLSVLVRSVKLAD